MKKQLIEDKLPKRNEYSTLSPRIPRDLFEKVNHIRIKKEVSWNDLITACLSQFMEEVQNKDKS